MALPFLLAGPIVRRVDSRSATFWMAFSEPATLEAWVFSGDQLSAGDGAVVSGDAFVAHSSATGTRAFGDHLHVATVTAAVTVGAFVPGSYYSYDISVLGHGGLKELGLLSDASGGDGIDAAAPGRLALGYLPDRLPSFVTPPATLADLKLVHTSCRKPHGLGPDALPWLDDLIGDERLSPVDRPHQLFLTGDQIYADDVAAPLLPMLTRLGTELLGYEETVPMAGGAAGAGTTRTKVTDLPAMRRGRLVLEVAKFSTSAGGSHLLGFGEFAAMYLAAWSPRVWRALAGRDELFVTVPPADLAARHLTDFEGRYGDTATWRAHDEKAEVEGAGNTGDEAKAVTAFALAVPKVARVLANTPTYMVFDDHEITDDWYLSAPWRTRVLTAPLGRSVIRNGLMAYAAFQAPGNDPTRWGSDIATIAANPPELAFQQHVETLLADRDSPTVGHENDVDEDLGLTSPTAEPLVRFHYVVDGPRHKVVVLDTRTRRTYDSAVRHSPPKLLGKALDAMLPAGPLADGRELLVVVSAAPVLFPRIFDALVQPMAAAVFDLKTHMSGTEAFDPTNPRPQIVGAEEWDIEGWGANEPAFHQLLRRLATYPRVVVLSGDVHFASSLVCDVWAKGDDTVDSRILQCTASASKNEPEPTMRAVLRGSRSAQRLLQGRAVERLGWDGDHGIVLPQGAHISPGRRGRLRHKPAYLPAGGWPGGTQLDGAKPPDVRYRISVLRDERASRGVGAPAPPVALPPWNPGDPIAAYALIAAAHAALVTDETDLVRLMVFRSNVGTVSFEPSGGAEHRVTHAVTSPVGDGTTGSPFTHHTVDFAPSAAAPPPTLTTGA